MTADAPPGGPPSLAGRARPTALRLARVHLRMGSLGLARAELEAAAGRGELDEEALLDLTEVRWRTGDLGGAGEVANAYLATGRRHPLALIVAAEAVAALGRPSEARRLASAALAAVDGELDPLFAGMPRSLIWPAEVVPGDEREDADRAEALDDGGDVERTGVAAAPIRSLWDEPVTAPPGTLPDATEALDAGRVALEHGELEAGAVQLAIALRLSPVLAPAVLDATGLASSPALDLVRGDAYRLVGREVEARDAYAAAFRALGDRDVEPDADEPPRQEHDEIDEHGEDEPAGA